MISSTAVVEQLIDRCERFHAGSRERSPGRNPNLLAANQLRQALQSLREFEAQCRLAGDRKNAHMDETQPELPKIKKRGRAHGQKG